MTAVSTLVVVTEGMGALRAAGKRPLADHRGGSPAGVAALERGKGSRVVVLVGLGATAVPFGRNASRFLSGAGLIPVHGELETRAPCESIPAAVHQDVSRRSRQASLRARGAIQRPCLPLLHDGSFGGGNACIGTQPHKYGNLPKALVLTFS